MTTPKRPFFLLGFAAIFLALAIIFWPSGILGHDVQIISVEQNGVPTGRGFISVPMLKHTDDAVVVSAGLDMNGNDTIEDSEVVVKAVPAYTREDWPTNFAVELPDPLPEKIRVMVLLGTNEKPDRESISLAASVVHDDIGDLIDLSTVTKPNESMKQGQTVVRQPAQKPPEGVPHTFKTDTPDLKQNKDECAPTSAANSIIRLAGDHDRIDAIPRDPSELVSLLKKEMGWTYQDGVLVGNFSPGKDFVARQLNLPIRSETVTGGAADIMNKVEGVMNEGGAAEIRIQSTVVDSQGKTRNIGGHMVTVVGMTTVGRDTTIQVHDPLSPAGTDTYKVDEDGTLIGYPYLGGDKSDLVKIRIRAGFLQRWIEPEEQSIIDDLEPTGRTWIKAIMVEGHPVALSEVHVMGPDKCDSDHYHAVRGGMAKALDGASVIDPGGCGFGKVADVPVIECSPDGKTCR